MRLSPLEVILVFFFKQKTAYEMRISDWSSDVCSSDLAKRGLHGPLRSIVRDAQCLREIPPGRDCMQEIGRASCRERVCQVRVDLGGRRIIKKTRSQQNA